MAIPAAPIEDLFTFRIDVGVEIAIPPRLRPAQVQAWARHVVDRDRWCAGHCGAPALAQLGEGERMLVLCLLEVFSLVMEQGRAPVFDRIEVAGLEARQRDGMVLALELRAPRIAFVPPRAYEIAVQAALRACHWMAAHAPTPGNRQRLYRSLEQAVKALHGLVPGGNSTIPVLKVAHALGIPFIHLGAGIYQLGWGSKARGLDRSTTELDSAMGARLARNKVTTAGLLRLGGLPAPVHIVVDDEQGALAAAERLGYPVVVKPVDGERGEGVSVDIRDRAALKTALSHARGSATSKQAIVERQVDGVCHRLFVAHGRLLYAVRRLPMSVRGDGRRTVGQLVADEVAAQEQKPPWARSELRPLDERARAALAAAGLSPQSVPAAGVLAPLRRIESTADGGVDQDVTATVHPDNVAAALAAARLFRLNVAGIDIISADIARPWHGNGAIINEVNFAPLLGGADISRSHIGRYLAELVEGDGRIPIETFGTRRLALEAQAARRAQGLRCWFTGPRETIDCAGQPLALAYGDDLKAKLLALICRADVDAVAVWLPRSQG